VLVLDVDISTSNLSEVVRALKPAASGLPLCDTIVVAQTGFGGDTATVVFDDRKWADEASAFAI
jgi:hypothetical protein